MALPAGTELTRTVRLVRRINAPPERVSRAWTDPEELARWFTDRVEGALADDVRTVLVWRNRRVWWEVVDMETGRAFTFRRPWLPDERIVTTVRVTFSPSGYGTQMTLEDGPSQLDQEGGLDAWAESIRTWSEAFVMLRAYLDFSVDIRPRS